MRILLLVLALLIILDGILTNILVTHDLAYEVNPILSNVAGTPGLIFIKLLSAVLAVIILWRIYRRHRMLALSITTSFVVVYTGIVFWSSIWLF